MPQPAAKENYLAYRVVGMEELFPTPFFGAASREEGQRLELYALLYQAIGRRTRILKRGMRHEPRDTVARRIVALEQQHFVLLHSGNVEPAVRRVVLHRIGLADAIAVYEVRGDQISRGRAVGVA